MNGRRRRSAFMFAGAGALLLWAAGCSVQPSVSSGQSSPAGPSGQWRIVVKRVFGPNHKTVARNAYESLKAVKGLLARRLAVQHDPNVSIITYGRYGGVKDRQARKDLALIKSLSLPGGGYPFLAAHLEPIPTPDPPVKSAWLLKNAPGVWTLHIATFDQPASRKQDAVDLVKTLRSKRQEAYVQHLPTYSIVTVGAFPETAVQQTVRRAITGGVKPKDPKLIKLREQYPYLLINGQYARYKTKSKSGKKISHRLKSRLIRIPKTPQAAW